MQQSFVTMPLPPLAPGNSGDVTFVLQIPAKSPSLAGHSVGKITALDPTVCFVFFALPCLPM